MGGGVAVRMLAVVVLASCAAPSQAVSPVRPVSPPLPVVMAPPPAEPASPERPRCVYPQEPRTELPALTWPEEGACRSVSPALTRSVMAEVRKNWRRVDRRERLAVRGGCDRLGERITTLVVAKEVSSSFPVWLMSLEWRGEAYQMLLIEHTPRERPENYPPWMRMPERRERGDPSQVVAPRTFAYSARLHAAAVAPLLARVRAAVHLEVAVSPDQGNALGLSHGFMEHHFFMHVADDQGRGLAGSYQPAATSLYGQPWTARLAVAERAVGEFIDSPAIRSGLTPASLYDPGVRALFSRVFWRSLGGGMNFGFCEQIVDMTARLGGPQHVPGLLDVLGSSVGDRERDLVLRAISAIANYDGRYDAKNRSRPPEQIVEATRADCRWSP